MPTGPSERELAGAAGGELDDLAVDADPDRGGVGGGHPDPQQLGGEVQVDAPVAPVADLEVEAVQLLGQAGG